MVCHHRVAHAARRHRTACTICTTTARGTCTALASALARARARVQGKPLTLTPGASTMHPWIDSAEHVSVATRGKARLRDSWNGAQSIRSGGSFKFFD